MKFLRTGSTAQTLNKPNPTTCAMRSPSEKFSVLTASKGVSCPLQTRNSSSSFDLLSQPTDVPSHGVELEIDLHNFGGSFCSSMTGWWRAGVVPQKRAPPASPKKATEKKKKLALLDVRRYLGAHTHTQTNIH